MEPHPRLVDPVDETDDLDLLAARKGPLDVGLVDPGVENDKCPDRIGHSPVPSYVFALARSVASVAVEGGVREAPTCGRSTSQSCALSAANANFAASCVLTLRTASIEPAPGGDEDVHVGREQRHELPAGGRPLGADVDVDEVAGRDLADQAVRRVHRDGDRALPARDLIRDRGRATRS